MLDPEDLWFLTCTLYGRARTVLCTMSANLWCPIFFHAIHMLQASLPPFEHEHSFYLFLFFMRGQSRLHLLMVTTIQLATQCKSLHVENVLPCKSCFNYLCNNVFLFYEKCAFTGKMSVAVKPVVSGQVHPLMMLWLRYAMFISSSCPFSPSFHSGHRAQCLMLKMLWKSTSCGYWSPPVLVLFVWSSQLCIFQAFLFSAADNQTQSYLVLEAFVIFAVKALSIRDVRLGREELLSSLFPCLLWV